MKRLAVKAGLSEIVLITFVLNGLPEDVDGTLMMNNGGRLTWGYIYSLRWAGLDWIVVIGLAWFLLRKSVLGLLEDSPWMCVRWTQR
jgi:hypothetical protein